jgi:hypothetical protein
MATISYKEFQDYKDRQEKSMFVNRGSLILAHQDLHAAREELEDEHSNMIDTIRAEQKTTTETIAMVYECSLQ